MEERKRDEALFLDCSSVHKNYSVLRMKNRTPIAKWNYRAYFEFLNRISAPYGTSFEELFLHKNFIPFVRAIIELEKRMIRKFWRWSSFNWKFDLIIGALPHELVYTFACEFNDRRSWNIFHRLQIHIYTTYTE